MMQGKSMFKNRLRLYQVVPVSVALLAAACTTPVQTLPSHAEIAVPISGAAVAPAPVSSVAAASGVQAAPSMEIKFAVAGDIMAHDSQLAAAYDRKCDCYDFKPVFATAAPLFKDVDVAVANLETTLPGKNYSGYPAFGAPDSLIDAVTGAGINLLIMANNHCLDKGRDTLVRTLQVLDEKKVPHLGVYGSQKEYAENRIFLLKKNGLAVALLNYTYGTNGRSTPKGVVVNRISEAQVGTDIARAREMKVDAVIVFYHFGTEYLNKPDRFQLRMVQHALASGADIVLGGHPHHVQPYELLDVQGKPHLVAYSVGNFVSAQRERYTDGGMVLYFTLAKKPDSTLDIKDVRHKLVWIYISHEGEKKQFHILPVEDTLAMKEGAKLPPQAIAGMTAFRNDVEEVLKVRVSAGKKR
jgi:poly-gamma-glutamate capsule biosynthesis protein CapA/YwtB (metallophosphatase superfamily)